MRRFHSNELFASFVKLKVYQPQSWLLFFASLSSITKWIEFLVWPLSLVASVPFPKAPPPRASTSSNDERLHKRLSKADQNWQDMSRLKNRLVIAISNGFIQKRLSCWLAWPLLCSFPLPNWACNSSLRHNALLHTCIFLHLSVIHTRYTYNVWLRAFF